MTRKTIIVVWLVVLGLGPFRIAEAQQLKKIGFLIIGFPPPQPAPPNENIIAFQKGLQELGYATGKNILIEYRYARGRSERLSELTEELVRLKVDTIVAPSTPSIRAAMQTTTKIPIVILSAADDPITEGFVESLARPGGNITGVSGLGFELSGKLLEVLTETVPGRTPIGVLSHPVNRAKSLTAIKSVASALKIQLQIMEVGSRNDFTKAFSSLVKEHARALIMLPAVLFARNQNQIADVAIKNRLPAIFYQRRFAEVGGLMAYGPSLPELWRRMGVLVGKVLNGSKPAELPVEQPTKFELVINLKTAQQIGLTIPQSVLFRADKVIR
jgi:putative tryptophan/tyrosine transport system substrate-binding protein